METRMISAAEHAFAHWYTVAPQARIEVVNQVIRQLERSERHFVDALQLATFHVRCVSYLASLSPTLPCITGERNQLRWRGRGIVLCGVGGQCTSSLGLALSLSALSCGNVVLLAQHNRVASKMVDWLYQHSGIEGLVQLLPEGNVDALLSHGALQACCLCGSVEEQRDYRRKLAAAPGGLASLLCDNDATQLVNLASPNLCKYLMSEHCLSENVTALGGNATLLAQSGDIA